MARHENPVRVMTPISIYKTQKARMRKYAQPDQKRKGNESDSTVFERILKAYEDSHPIDCEPKSTYDLKA